MVLWQGAAKRLDDIDINRVAHRLGVGEDELHAVMDVEARNSGFDSKGRLTMLFEPHVFYRELGAGAARDHAERAGVAYPKWGTRKYPSDSYRRLQVAYSINPRAALRSCSWGLGQIMGFNASLAGYDSAAKMVTHFAEDEENQLNGMASFIINAGLDDELRAHDWRGFARGYNGPGYAKHGYHTRLAQRYAWWAKKPDTPWNPADDREVHQPDLNAPTLKDFDKGAGGEDELLPSDRA